MKTVIEMAIEVGISDLTISLYQQELERCAELVRADERAACLQIADQCADADMHASMAANAIRARGNT